MQQPNPSPPPAFSNYTQSQYQRPAVQGMQQPTPMQVNHFTGQQPFAGQFGATPPSIPQQPPMQQQAFQHQYPYAPGGQQQPQIKNPQSMQQVPPGQQQYQPIVQQPMQQASSGHQQHQPMAQQPIQHALPAQQQYRPMVQQPMQQFPLVPPQAQGRPAATPSGDGQSGVVYRGNAEGSARGSHRVQKQSPFRNRNLWVDGKSVVGRKGKDGEWEEVRCSVM